MELSPGECFHQIARADPCCIIDVRTNDEFSQGHLEGAENIDFFLPDFNERLKTRDRHIRYIVYCRRGHRGRKVMELMGELGFLDVINIAGGFESWATEGLPIERLSP